jgi:hypothetical protein
MSRLLFTANFSEKVIRKKTNPKRAIEIQSVFDRKWKQVVDAISGDIAVPSKFSH